MITTPSVDTLPTLDVNFLSSVSGGCHKQCAPQPIINNNNITVPTAAAVPQAPAPAPAPAYDPGPQVSTSVSINGQAS